MSALDDLLQIDAQTVHASPDMMFEVESVTYKVNGSNTNTRTFTVSVNRYTLDNLDGVPVPHIEIFVPRSSTATVGIESVNLKVDKVSIAIAKNGTPVDHPVIAIIDSDDAGGFRLKLR